MGENYPAVQDQRAVAAVNDPLQSLLRQDAIKKRFEGMLGKKAAGFMSSIISATQANRELKKCDPLSIVSAAAVAAALDLPINPSLGFAHIVPYGGKAQFQMGWRGFVQLGMRTGQYKTINVCSVYEGELVSRNRFTGEMEFDEARRTSETVVGYVAYFKLVNGFEKWFYMTDEEVSAHGKKYSQSYSNPNSQWQKNPEAMKLKTALKLLLSKYGILSIEMQTAVMADQAVVKESGRYTYPDGRDSDGDVLDAEEDDPAAIPDRTPADLIAAFDRTIPAKADPAMVEAYLAAVAAGNKTTVEAVKIEGAKSEKDLADLWKIFPGWCKQQAAKNKSAETAKNGNVPAAMTELAPAECPDNPGSVYAKAYCDKCAKRQGCPAWDAQG